MNKVSDKKNMLRLYKYVYRQKPYCKNKDICIQTQTIFAQTPTICLEIYEYVCSHKQYVKDIEICVQRQTICLEIDEKGIRHKKYVENIII